MAGTTTIYKSVTLEPGEQFTLPPNSELIGASAPEQLDSTCDLPTLEELGCYAFTIGLNPEEGAASEIFEADNNSNIYISGIKVGNTSYSFSSPVTSAVPTGLIDLVDLANKINTAGAGEVLLNVSTGFKLDYGIGTGSRATMNYIVFKTLPSIGSSIRLICSASAPVFTVPASNPLVAFEIPARPYADVSDFENIPECS